MNLVKLLLLIFVILSIGFLVVVLSKKTLTDSMLDLSQLQDKTTNLTFISTPFPSEKPPLLRKCMGKNQCF